MIEIKFFILLTFNIPHSLPLVHRYFYHQSLPLGQEVKWLVVYNSILFSITLIIIKCYLLSITFIIQVIYKLFFPVSIFQPKNHFYKSFVLLFFPVKKKIYLSRMQLPINFKNFIKLSKYIIPKIAEFINNKGQVCNSHK